MWSVNIIWIGFASAIFPVVMNLVFNFRIPLNINTILFFVVFGIGLYFFYILGKIIYTALGLAEKSAKVIAYPITARSQRKKEEMEEKMEKLVKKEEEEEKERKRAEKAKKKEKK